MKYKEGGECTVYGKCGERLGRRVRDVTEGRGYKRERWEEDWALGVGGRLLGKEGK